MKGTAPQVKAIPTWNITFHPAVFERIKKINESFLGFIIIIAFHFQALKQDTQLCPNETWLLAEARSEKLLPQVESYEMFLQPR